MSKLIAGLGERESGEAPSFGRLPAALHLLALFDLAVAQPLLDVLARQANFLVAHKLQPWEIVTLTLALCWGCPVILIALGRLMGSATRRAETAFHLLLILLLLGACSLLALNQISALPNAVVLGAVLVISGLGLRAYLRFDKLRTFIGFLASSAVIVPLVFWLSPTVRDLVVPPKANTEEAAGASSTPVVMIVFDALPLTSLIDRDGEIVEGRYPAFAKLARDAHWFRNATSINDETRYALPAILTGQYPSKGKLPIFAHYPHSLFTLLSSRYQMRVIEEYSRLCPADLCDDFEAVQPAPWARWKGLAADLGIVYLYLVVPDRLTPSLPPVHTRWKGFTAAARIEQGREQPLELNPIRSDFERFLDSLGEGPDATLYFIHALLPHVPWIFSPSGKEYGRLHDPDDPDGVVDDTWSDDQWLLLQGLQRHLLQLGFADKLLGEVLQRLDQLGLYDKALILVTADHGASFRRNDLRRGISPTNYHEILPIPLFLKAPGQRQGVVHDDNVETIDILPTLAGILGIEPSWDVKGQNALGSAFEPRSRKVFLEVEGLRALPLGDRIDQKLVSAGFVVDHFGGDWDSLFGLGASDGLIGRSWDELELAAPRSEGERFEVSFEQAWLFEDLSVDGAYLPTRILGTLTPGTPGRGPYRLAVAINGRIRAVTQTVPPGPGAAEDAPLAFSAMVPEQSFRDGRNEVLAFVLPSEGRPTLVPTRSVQAVTYSLDDMGILASSGQRFVVEPGALAGSSWVAGVGLEGWAADLKAQVPAERIVVFADGEFTSVAQLHFQTPELEGMFENPRLGSCGFRAILLQAAKANGQGLRVFAILGDRAAELPLVESPRSELVRTRP